MPYSKLHTPWVEEAWETPETALHNTDGARLYETDGRALLHKIIELNDVPRLKQYISVYSPPLEIKTRENVDPLCVAAATGRTDAPRVLVDYYNTEPTKVPLHQRMVSLLTLACKDAHIETARFILDYQPALRLAHVDDSYGDEALLAAARSLTSLPIDGVRIDTPCDYDEWMNNRISRGEQLIHLHLDKGASAQAVEPPITQVWVTRLPSGSYAEKHSDDERPLQPSTVLGLASSRASCALVKRLIDHGANPHAKQQYQHNPGSTFYSEFVFPLDVTAIHISSMFWNMKAVQALHDYHDSDITEPLSCLDSNGRLPLHWAAAGPGSFESRLPDDEINSRLTSTFKLLLSGYPGNSNVNAPDNQGESALHYAVRAHACCGGSKHFNDLVMFLLENGADASVVDINGQTVLHKLAARCMAGEPIDTTLIGILLLHGVKMNQQDSDGNTALHLMARNLRQTQAAKFLLSRGADVSLTNAKGDTALHECMVMGIILQRQTRKGASLNPTLADRTRALDEMVCLLLEAAEGDSMMDQPNSAGETPRQLQSKKLVLWQERKPDAVTRNS
ncbi:hypothetical protein N7471_000807 [Penicillium samsonianum]|uniref:uncharacterized protein n=1 Tax=Penicillium samsonianum TaxID=1882272 RepID=UPI0025466A2C|nr:uncharacterized protein N7471_000807 [Penicillium samsonianum]KAJ6149608.1 hypothetical protein N7471_000807 [Penicillium samsonianum]